MYANHYVHCLELDTTSSNRTQIRCTLKRFELKCRYTIGCYNHRIPRIGVLSYLDLYTSNEPLIASADGNPKAAVFGVPFDSTHSYRPGTRFGADVIRGAFNNIEVFHPDKKIDLEETSIADYGNLTHTVSSKEMLNMVGKVTSEIYEKRLPLMILGGEHLLTLGSYMQMPSDTAYVVFDAHYDLRDSYAGAHNSHASYLRRIIEQRGAENIIHVGARAFVADELEFLVENKMKNISNKQIQDGMATKILSDELSAYNNIYASFDLDVLDPAFAPGVGNPEACGITSRELFSMIKVLNGKKISCADIVELNPTYDNGSTASLAAKIMSNIFAMQLVQS